MALEMSAALADLMSGLRYEHVRQRIRVSRAGTLVAETTEALLVWEPRSKIPSYAVPLESIVVPTSTAPYAVPDPADRPSAIPYEQRGRLHLDPGQTVTLTVDGTDLEGVGYQFDDPDLAKHVLLRWTGFEWDEEATRMLAHPQDPFVRVSTRRSDRLVRVSSRGRLLAETRDAVLLLETGLPPRWYLPRADLTPGLLVQSATRTECSYKGVASYLSLGQESRGRDLAWFYPDPLIDAEPVRDRVCFWAERTDLELDGVAIDRPER
jgi:uncharacterized protein (DUF427 family)